MKPHADPPSHPASTRAPDCGSLICIPQGSYPILPLERVLPLHAMPVSCGRSIVRDSSYDWDGAKRGENRFAVVQYTICGEGALEYEGTVLRLLPHMFMIVHIPHSHRYYLPRESESWHFAYAVLAGKELLRVLENVETRWGPCIGPAHMGAAVDALSSLLQAAYRGSHSSFHFSTLAYRLSMELAAAAEARSNATVEPEWLIRTKDYISAHIGAELSLDLLAQVAGFSRYHFCRRFTQEESVSPRRYIERHRLRVAAGLLSAHALSIKQVAADCGYGDVNYFCRVFRRVFGMSPGAFRRSGM